MGCCHREKHPQQFLFLNMSQQGKESVCDKNVHVKIKTLFNELYLLNPSFCGVS